MFRRSPEDLKQYKRDYYLKNKKRLDKYSNDWYQNLRLKFINLLGRKCAHCSINDPVVLDFDHINDNGAEHRRKWKNNRVASLLNKFPEEIKEFQLLCKNCNWKKEFYRRRPNAVSFKEAA